MSRRAVPTTLIVATACALALFQAGCGSDGDTAKGSQALATVEFRSYLYRDYLVENASALVDWVKQLRGQIAAGEIGKAGSRYATSRVQYGQVEAGAESFPELDKRIDVLPDEVPADKLTGFHRIEKSIFAEETLAGMKPVALQLLRDVELLRRKLRRVELEPMEIADSATRLLNEVLATTLTGKEDRYSQIGLVDASANVEAAEAAFEALVPLLAEDPALVEEIGERLDNIYVRLSLHGSPSREPDQSWYVAPGAVFGALDEQPRSYVRKLTRQIEELAKLYSRIPSKIQGQ
jgi:iron uptake system component EfeO